MGRGYVTQASYAWYSFFFNRYHNYNRCPGTVFSTLSGYYILAIVIAGLLLNSRAMAGVGILSMAAITGLKMAENAGWLPPASPSSSVRIG